MGWVAGLSKGDWVGGLLWRAWWVQAQGLPASAGQHSRAGTAFHCLQASPPPPAPFSSPPPPPQVKLISEPWDIGAYMVGSWPNWDIWAEWNGKYRDDVRRFLRWA